MYICKVWKAYLSKSGRLVALYDLHQFYFGIKVSYYEYSVASSQTIEHNGFKRNIKKSILDKIRLRSSILERTIPKSILDKIPRRSSILEKIPLRSSILQKTLPRSRFINISISELHNFLPEKINSKSLWSVYSQDYEVVKNNFQLFSSVIPIHNRYVPKWSGGAFSEMITFLGTFVNFTWKLFLCCKYLSKWFQDVFLDTSLIPKDT